MKRYTVKDESRKDEFAERKKEIMKKTIFLLALVILTIGGQKMHAQTEETSCSIRAYIKDTGTVNVRSKPAGGGKVLAKLIVEVSDTALPAITVEIVGYSNGWVKISSAKKLSGELAISKKVSSEEVFSGSGWIPAKLLTTRTKISLKTDKSVQLYTEPETSSRKSGNIPNDYPVIITGFKCGWLKIEYKSKTGWIRKINVCGNPTADCN